MQCLVSGEFCYDGRQAEHPIRSRSGARYLSPGSSITCAPIPARSSSDPGLLVSRDIANGWIRLSVPGQPMLWRRPGPADATKAFRSALSSRVKCRSETELHDVFRERAHQDHDPGDVQPEHPATLIVAALEQLETQRAAMQWLLDADLLRLCLV
jgi:hypothetical protein